MDSQRHCLVRPMALPGQVRVLRKRQRSRLRRGLQLRAFVWRCGELQLCPRATLKIAAVASYGEIGIVPVMVSSGSHRSLPEPGIFMILLACPAVLMGRLIVM